jgi:hypothetical protein
VYCVTKDPTKFANLAKIGASKKYIEKRAFIITIKEGCAQMVKNGFESVFALLSLLWTRLMSAS